MRNISSSSRAFSDLVSPSIVVNLMQRLRTFALLAVMSLVLSCDSPTEIRTGSIRIALLSEGGTPALVDSRKGDLNETPDMRAEGTLPNVLLDAVQVRVVGGGTDRTVTSTTPSGGNFLISVDNLPAASYTVSVTGLVNSQVAHFGETSGVQVTAGQTSQAAVTFPVFQPSIPNATVVDTSDVLSFDISYTAVTGATGYRIEWSQSSSFTPLQTKDTTGLGARIAVTAEGNYYVRVRALNPNLTAPGLATPTKGVFVHQGVAAVTVTPATPTIAAGATQLLTAEARDAVNAVVPSITWFWSSSNQSVALVSQSGLVTGVNGGAVTITAMARGTPGSAAVAVTARPATKLAFSAQPGNAAAGATIPTVRVVIQDATGATVTTDNTTQVTVAIGTNAGPGGVLGGLATVSVVAGIATFTDLSIPQAGAGYSLVSTATALTAATSANFNIAAGAATQLLFTVAPSTTAALAAMSPAVQVTVQDALGNRVGASTAAVTVAIGTNPSAGVLAGTRVVNAVSGVASFSGLSIYQGGTGYTLTASASGLTGVISAAFDIVAIILPASKLAFSAQPGNAAAGATIPPVRVVIQDATGATVTSDNTTQVSVAIGTDAGPGGVLGGLATVSAVAGVATFSALTIPQAGAGYTLVTTATGLTGATSAIFNIAAGAATQLAFTVAPSATAANAAMSPAVQVTVRDALGNRVAGATDAVTLAIGTNPSTGVLGGTKVVNAVGGVASFSGISIDQGGTGYTLTANATGLTLATSGAFNITAALPASVLIFSIQPASGLAGDPLSPAVQVEIRNSNNERVTTARDAVTLNFQANPGGGTITGTKIVNAIGGIASFTGLAINKAANGYTFAATSGSLTAATSTAFNITPGAPNRLRFLTQPANVKGNVAQGTAITVAISDAFDNTVTSATSNVTLALGTNPWKSIFATTGGGSVSATSLTIAAVAGVATFANVRVDKPANGYTLSAASAAITAAASSAFNVNLTFDGQVSAGGSHTCAISTESGTYCWGFNGSGQLGAVGVASQGDSIPALVAGGLAFVAITSGQSHTCGLLASGAAYCWGFNGSGQLGNNTTAAAAAPVAVSSGLVFAMIDAGSNLTCGVTTASGTAAIDRQVYCWGSGGSGELGNAANANSSLPVRVAEPLQTTTRAVSVAVGGNHACAVAVNSVAYCWGNNGFGQLGTAAATTTSANVPTQVHAAGPAYTWTSITSSLYHTCGIAGPGGSVARCWGYGQSGALGDNLATTSTIPVTVAGSLTNWVRVTAGNQLSCGSTPAFSQCWGINYNGQLGSEETINQQNTPTLVAGAFAFTSLDAGQDHSCAKTGTGASSVLYCWGYNGNGRLGSTGVNQSKRTPTLVVQ